MDAEEFTEDENHQILRIIAEAKDDLYVDEYQVYFELECKQELDKDGQEIGASVSVDTQYLTVSITFYPKSVRVFRGNIEVFRQCVYHELAHVIIDPLHKLFAKFLDGKDITVVEDYLIDEKWESAVERVSRIAYILRRETNRLNNLKAKMKEIIG